MATGSIEKYEGKKGHSWRLRVVTGYDERGYPVVRRHTLKGGTKREAEARLRELVNEVDKGLYIEPSLVTVREYIGQWFETHCQGLALSTVLRYRGHLDCHIIPHLGHVPLQKLTVLQVQSFANHLLKSGYQGKGSPRGLSPKSVKDAVGLLKLSLEQAITWGLLTRNPAVGVKIPKVVHKEMQVITEAQAEMILSALEGTYVWLPTMIAYHTGMRRGEILALCWDCVDLEKATIKVSHSFSLQDKKGPLFKEPKTKAGRRTVEIGPTLVHVLQKHRKLQVEAKLAKGKKWKNKHNLVCTRDDGSYIPPKALSEFFSYQAKQLGIDLTFHGLRHTHVSMLIKAGVPINVISARIGHSNPSTTHDVYSHLLPGMSREAVDRFEKLLQASLTLP